MVKDMPKYILKQILNKFNQLFTISYKIHRDSVFVITFNNFHRFNKEFEDNKPSWSINKNNPNDFNQRDIRGDNDGKNDSNAPFKIDLSTPNDSHMNSPSSNVEVKDNPSITSYLFVPPNESNGTPFNSKIKSDNYNSVTLSGELLPPGPNPAKIFSKISKDKLPSSTWDKSSSVIIPARNYGDPGFGVVDYDIQVGNRDCDKKRIPPSIIGHNYDHVSNYNPTLGQGFPSSNNKLDSPTNAIYDPHQGLIQQSNGWGSNYPQWGGNIPNIPPNWGGNVPNIPPNWGANINSPSWNGNINDPGWGECCRLPTSRRFSIVSPGFPGGSSNAYSCRYTIVKSSPEVTSLRLNFRFFNLGSEDPFCSNGHLEIDGQLFCGCKSGQTYQTLFTDFSPKIITVTYSDFPRSKFSGFLIDVYQDSFSPNPNNYPPPNQINSPYPQYPIVYPPASPINSPYPQNPNTYDPASQINSPHPGFLRRHERMLDNSTDIVPSPLDPLYHKINKRNVGYTYSKPNVPFNLDTRYNNPEIIVGKSHERFFGGGSCQSRIFWDWIVASKESILRNVRCNAAYGFNSRSYLPPDNSKADRKPY